MFPSKMKASRQQFFTNQHSHDFRCREIGVHMNRPQLVQPRLEPQQLMILIATIFRYLIRGECHV
jgi:hypothetical protein